MRWFRALMPREEKFFDMFNRQSKTLELGAQALRALLEGGPDSARYCALVMQHEEEADAITREVLLAVGRTFITPFDRGDIKDLITLMDDAIDQMQKTAKSTRLYEITKFEPNMKTMGDQIVKVAALTAAATPLMASIGENSAKLNAYAQEVVRIEEASDTLYDEGRRALFLTHRNEDPLAFVVGCDVYEHLEKVLDRFEDVANKISSILIEHL
ncbi:MAG: nuclease [Hyphomicrobiales bacterium]|nr:nuclease [Hyphomicrobiales bacterium]